MKAFTTWAQKEISVFESQSLGAGAAAGLQSVVGACKWPVSAHSKARRQTRSRWLRVAEVPARHAVKGFGKKASSAFMDEMQVPTLSFGS